LLAKGKEKAVCTACAALWRSEEITEGGQQAEGDGSGTEVATSA